MIRCVGYLQDTVSERLRRWTRNPLGSARRGSNPLGVAMLVLGPSWLVLPGLARGNLLFALLVTTDPRPTITKGKNVGQIRYSLAG